MKLKVTVNGVAYDIEVEVEEQERRPALGSITIGGGGGAAAAPTTASVQAASANAVVAPLSGAVLWAVFFTPAFKHSADIQQTPASHRNKTTRHENPRKYAPAREGATAYPANPRESTPHPVQAQPAAWAHRSFYKNS